MKFFDLTQSDAETLSKFSITRPYSNDGELRDKVKVIIDRVKSEGDSALSYFSKEFDRCENYQLEYSREMLNEAKDYIPTNLKNAIGVATNNISKFHNCQLKCEEKIETTNGVNCWREARAIERVGFYIPGGTAPLISTLLMLAIPARAAGVKEIAIFTPPNSQTYSKFEENEQNINQKDISQNQKEFLIHPAILYVASLFQISEVYALGGAQAIAAMAFGTTTIKKVDKILGPGNQYVNTAKLLVASEGVAIDMPAGPSEVLIIADETADTTFIAADLLSQAEHGVDSQVVLITTSKNIYSSIESELEKQVKQLSRASIAKKSLEESVVVLVNDINTALEISNMYAPEHLILSTVSPELSLKKIQNAGSVFIGNYSPEVAGDYASGTNHVLPTAGAARSFSGVSVDTFIKKITFQEISREGLCSLAPSIIELATTEGLEAHASAIKIRTES